MSGESFDRNHHPRKPWHGAPGAPAGPRKTPAGFMTELWDSRPDVIRAHPRRIQTKAGYIKRLQISRPAFNRYYEDLGARFPLPAPDHLVYVVDASTGEIIWASPSVWETLHGEPSDILERRISTALCGGQDLMQTAPEIFEIAERLKRQSDGLEETYAMDLVRLDDQVRIPVELNITYGAGYDVFFVDGVVTGAAMPVVAPLEKKDLGEDMLSNVEPGIVYTLVTGSGKTAKLLEQLGYRS